MFSSRLRLQNSRKFPIGKWLQIVRQIEWLARIRLMRLFWQVGTLLVALLPFVSLTLGSDVFLWYFLGDPFYARDIQMRWFTFLCCILSREVVRTYDCKKSKWTFWTISKGRVENGFVAMAYIPLNTKQSLWVFKFKLLLLIGISIQFYKWL